MRILVFGPPLSFLINKHFLKHDSFLSFQNSLSYYFNIFSYIDLLYFCFPNLLKHFYSYGLLIPIFIRVSANTDIFERKSRF